jgi:hypothetical protein
MSRKAGLSYGLGVSLGLGSYFASRGLSEQKSARDIIRDHVVALQAEGIPVTTTAVDAIVFQKYDTKLGIFLPVPQPEVHATFAAARGSYRDELYTKSQYGPVYDFGERIGLAEGQASAGGDPAAAELARDALRQAREKASALRDYGISPSDVPATPDHPTILKKRQEWQKLFTESPAL